MKIECVTVCKGFGDILEHSILHNQPLFDRWLIVTTRDDDETHRVCKRHGIDFVDTDAFTRKGEKFNKALAINVGLAHLTCADWILHLDADILLPPQTRRFLENAELNPKCIHGVDRFNMVGSDIYAEWKKGINPQYEWFCLINPPANTVFGSRIVHFDYGGWMPIGFFQLWNGPGSGVTRYPIKANTDAEHTDVLHAMKWPRAERILIPEILAVHLESERVKWGANWNERVSKPFVIAPAYAGAGMPKAGDPKSPLATPEGRLNDAIQRTAQTAEMYGGHHHDHHHHHHHHGW